VRTDEEFKDEAARIIAEHGPTKPKKHPFDYQKPTQNQVDRIAFIRKALKSAHDSILAFAPPSRERSLAVTKLEEVSMWANKAIVFEEEVPHSPHNGDALAESAGHTALGGAVTMDEFATKYIELINEHSPPGIWQRLYGEAKRAIAVGTVTTPVCGLLVENGAFKVAPTNVPAGASRGSL
jgi:hypothetical protein